MSQPDVIVVAGYLVRCPLGGYAWQILHYIAGLRALGFDAYFYEDTAFYYGSYDPISNRENVGFEHGVAFTRALFERFGLGQAWMFWDAQKHQIHAGAKVDRDELLNAARVVLTLAPVTRLARRGRQTKVFLDLDPGFTQIRAAQGDAPILGLLQEHDVHFTFGENIGTPGCQVPTAGFHWRPTRQPIVLDYWEPLPTSRTAAYTTVGKWNEKRRDVRLGGDAFAWCKRSEWLKFLELPRLSGQTFRPALDTDSVEGDDTLLRTHGWDPIHPLSVSTDALVYRDFLRSSKGEFTVAKDLNIRLRTGWFSDRAACYLAAARPVITQDTGFESVLGSGDGLFAVRSLADAVTACTRIESDYAAQSRAARRVAERCFDSRQVLGRLLSEL